MPTDRNKVSAYLSDQDFALLGELAAHHRVSKSQMVALAIRYMSGESTPVNPVTNPTGNVPVENGVSEVTVGSWVESKLVELLSNPTEELKHKLDALFKEYVTNNGKIESLKETGKNSKGSEVTIETPKENKSNNVTVESSSPVSKGAGNPTITVAVPHDLTDPTIELQATQNNSSENPLEGGSSEIQEQSLIEEDKPDGEGISEDKPDKPDIERTEETPRKLNNTQLGKLIGVNGGTIARWFKRRYKSKVLTPMKNNEKKWKIFMEWEKQGNFTLIFVSFLVRLTCYFL